MPRHADEGDDEDYEADDWDDSEASEEDDDQTVPCPYCKKAIHEDAERCPHCESYISQEDAPPHGKPMWFIIGAIAALVVVYMWIVK